MVQKGKAALYGHQRKQKDSNQQRLFQGEEGHRRRCDADHGQQIHKAALKSRAGEKNKNSKIDKTQQQDCLFSFCDLFQFQSSLFHSRNIWQCASTQKICLGEALYFLHAFTKTRGHEKCSFQ
ncbi:MAG: hypothetical protein O2807_07020 [bacterium]|nr:hypothetical protein [bacterium]